MNDKKEQWKTEFVKEPDLNKWKPKIGFLITMKSFDFESVEETIKLETEIEGLIETAKIPGLK